MPIKHQEAKITPALSISQKCKRAQDAHLYNLILPLEAMAKFNGFWFSYCGRNMYLASISWFEEDVGLGMIPQRET